MVSLKGGTDREQRNKQFFLGRSINSYIGLFEKYIVRNVHIVCVCERESGKGPHPHLYNYPCTFPLSLQQRDPPSTFPVNPWTPFLLRPFRTPTRMMV